MADRTTARPSVEEFASVHARSALVTAYLLAGDWTSAVDLAAPALMSARRSIGSDQDSERAVTLALARRHVRGARGAWWSRDGGLHLQEYGARPAAAVDDPDGLWAALSQLTEQERAAMILRGITGMDATAVAAALGRSPADVRRDLATGDGVVSRLSRSEKPDDRAIETRLAAFFDAHRELRPTTARVVSRASAIEAQRRRVWLAAVAGGAAAVVVAAGVGLSALPSGRDQGASSGTSTSVVEDEPGWRPEIRQPSLPEVGPNRKLVGIRTVIVAVPASWSQLATTCEAVRRDAVIYPSGRRGRLCDDGTLPRGLSAVSFNRDMAVEPDGHGYFGRHRALGTEFVVTTPTRSRGRYVAYVSAPVFSFAMSVTARSERTLRRIIDSITVLPANFTVVPPLRGLGGDRLDAVLYGHRLVPERRYDANALVRTLAVAEQFPPPGTVVPEQTHVVLRMEPRFSASPALSGR